MLCRFAKGDGVRNLDGDRGRERERRFLELSVNCCCCHHLNRE